MGAGDGGHVVLKGENLLYLAVILIFDFFLFALLVKTGFIEYEIARWFMYPPTLLVPIISLVCAVGIRKGFIEDIPKERRIVIPITLTLSMLFISLSILLLFL